MNLLTTADWLVIAAYFIVLYVVVFRHSDTSRASSTEFFLAGRNAGWFIVGASIFATNIGSEHLVGLAGSSWAINVASALSGSSSRSAPRCAST